MSTTTSVRSLVSTLVVLLSLFHVSEARLPRSGRHVVQARAPGTWAYVGCYTDGVGGRTLAVNPGTPGGGGTLTVEKCTTVCRSLNYVLAGVEYGGECYCGNTFNNGGGPAPGGTGCNMACNGNATQICGGPNRLSLYDYDDAVENFPTVTSTSATGTPTATPIAGWTSLGCYTDGVGGRTLSTAIYTIPGGSMTPALCTAACKSAGYVLSGVEYGGECFCDNTFKNGGAPTTDGCTMPCNGNSAYMCGGPNRLNVYRDSSVASPNATGTRTGTSTSTSAPTQTGLPTGWTYKGCWLDQQFGRILSNQQPDSTSMTVQSCIAACRGAGYAIAGLEYYTQCFCGNAMINQASLATSESQCNTACGGNTAQFCGGGDRMSIYSSQNPLKVTPVPKTQKTDLPGHWNYTGCLYDDAVLRTFPYQLQLENNNTAKNCLTQCSDFGYGAGGMEFGEQCFCGDVSSIAAAGATLRAETDCNMVCSGNESYICGGPNRISYYQWIGEPLDLWDYPSGNAAGRYEFLIGGPTIPLIVTPAINGKVTFLEKFGTSPANNGTGAYELDLALVDDYEMAWRPMHVKTDIFCAAGLTLPDKAGRQIDIGGWANQDTHGIRLYWPDGEPGTWGVNDWQENAHEVALVDGRWYPTAMTMANGSILVMGGEVGSNGAPVPTLEVLPLPAGAGSLYCEYLERTDPYNLYPYLVVLPTGGIFVQYYNEARILDEGSLETQRVLPNAPAAVNNFLGGRTYPFEGTAMVLPQHAPYGDPLEIIVCGGTTPGPEIALDNCVSIKPEVPNANWTIERMPSKRVISCMAALPDGTYVIMNGGQQGRAGFGLCVDPNLNVVLYDPRKPYHRRMSVMSNTTIARLYHSSAVLLQDGRVLVSGSDPEDVRFPQEYRNEVWIPPYLLTGTARPTYTLSDADVGYGGTFTVTVTLHQGTTANMQVSLMASVSSTHGNSMGQRTIFPAFTCSGNVCTVTAPPNAHVSPPAWHMLFVLDGSGVPSEAQWIRIGGDPAGLGDWPNHPDFLPLPGV